MKTIYLADDDEDDRMLIHQALEQVVGHARIVELDSGDELIRLVKNQELSDDPSVIIMDMNMPRLNGLETLAILKADSNSSHIPVVMLSSTSHRDLVREAYGRGVNAFLEKPIHEDDFLKLARAVDTCFLNASHSSEETVRPTRRTEGSIVVIEDNEDHLFFIRRALRESMPDVHVIEFPSPNDVSEKLPELWDQPALAPQLILMDLYLPTRQDGLDLLVKIHQILTSKQCRSVPVVVFSYSARPEDMHASYERNANAYMTKGNNAFEWKNDFKNLHSFWWNTVAVPDPR